MNTRRKLRIASATQRPQQNHIKNSEGGGSPLLQSNSKPTLRSDKKRALKSFAKKGWYSQEEINMVYHYGQDIGYMQGCKDGVNSVKDLESLVNSDRPLIEYLGMVKNLKGIIEGAVDDAAEIGYGATPILEDLDNAVESLVRCMQRDVYIGDEVWQTAADPVGPLGIPLSVLYRLNPSSYHKIQALESALLELPLLTFTDTDSYPIEPYERVHLAYSEVVESIKGFDEELLECFLTEALPYVVSHVLELYDLLPLVKDAGMHFDHLDKLSTGQVKGYCYHLPGELADHTAVSKVYTYLTER